MGSFLDSSRVASICTPHVARTVYASAVGSVKIPKLAGKASIVGGKVDADFSAGVLYGPGADAKTPWYAADLVKLKERSGLPSDIKLPKSGSLIIGEHGSMVLPHVAGPRLYPLEKFAQYPYPKDVKGGSHWHIWVDSIFENKKTTDGFHYAGPLAETVQLGNIAARHPGTQFTWDSKAMKLTGKPEAEKQLTKEYRKGYEVTAA